MTPHDIAPIRNDDDHRRAVALARTLWGATPGSPEGDRLDVLMVLLDAYEAEHHRIEPPDPIEAIQVRMDELGIDRTRLAMILGTTSGRVSELLNRRRRLTIAMIRQLAGGLGLSERCLLQEYELMPSRQAA